MVTTKNFTLSSLNKLANEHLSKDYTYNNKTFNLKKLGWRFEFNTRKRSLGLCSPRNRTIYLSEWLIKNSNNSIETWENTILHEIAHAIDFTNRGWSSHDRVWRNIALSIGCDGERCSKVDKVANIKTKYTATCKNCSNTLNYHRKSRKIEQGQASCNKCSNTFDPKCTFNVTQNY